MLYLNARPTPEDVCGGGKGGQGLAERSFNKVPINFIEKISFKLAGGFYLFFSICTYHIITYRFEI